MTQNLVVIVSDQHCRAALGCYGADHVDTPALDTLARRGTRFDKAYCNAPICVPSRASMATGLHIHDIPAWDNADPFYGQQRSFMHRVQDAGGRTAAIGKLHFRSRDDDTGFDEQLLPMHVVNGTGTFTSLIRTPPPRIAEAGNLLTKAGAGKSPYDDYDAEICRSAVEWITEQEGTDRPFLLFVSFANPHPPYLADPSLFERYMTRDLPNPIPIPYALAGHPIFAGLKTYFDIDRTELSAQQQKAIAAAYYANVTALDSRIGQINDAIVESELSRSTSVVYTSDHGEALGSHGLYGKCSMFEPSMGVPMILSGPDIPAGQVCQTPVQLLDLYPTVLDLMGLPPSPSDAARRGKSLRRVASSQDRTRTIVAQQHCAGVRSGVFGVTDGRWKYIHCVDGPPLLFDLDTDPNETINTSELRGSEQIMSRLYAELCTVVDPVAADAACKVSQKERLRAAGGPEAILNRTNAAFTPAPAVTI